MKQLEILDAVKTKLEATFDMPVYIASMGDRPILTAFPFMVISDGIEGIPETSTGPGRKAQFAFSVIIAVQAESEYASIAGSAGILDYAAQIDDALSNSNIGVNNATVSSLWVEYAGTGPSIPTLMGDTTTIEGTNLPMLIEKQVNFIAEYFE